MTSVLPPRPSVSANDSLASRCPSTRFVTSNTHGASLRSGQSGDYH